MPLKTVIRFGIVICLIAHNCISVHSKNVNWTSALEESPSASATRYSSEQSVSAGEDSTLHPELVHSNGSAVATAQPASPTVGLNTTTETSHSATSPEGQVYNFSVGINETVTSDNTVFSNTGEQFQGQMKPSIIAVIVICVIILILGAFQYARRNYEYEVDEVLRQCTWIID